MKPSIRIIDAFQTPAQFRDQLIAASLKRAEYDEVDWIADSFRDQLIAASLKPHMSPATEETMKAVPRSADRGLIEATRIAGPL